MRLALTWRQVSLGLGALLIAACTLPQRAPFGDPAVCLQTFRSYDRAVRSAGPSATTQLRPQPQVARYGQLLITRGCLTRQPDLVGIESLAERLRPFEIVNSGAPTRASAVHAGIVDGFSSQARASSFFSSLGYRSRSIGAPGVGRRIYLGPFYSEGAIAQAIDVARQAGFVSPYLSDTKF